MWLCALGVLHAAVPSLARAVFPTISILSDVEDETSTSGLESNRAHAMDQNGSKWSTATELSSVPPAISHWLGYHTPNDFRNMASGHVAAFCGRAHYFIEWESHRLLPVISSHLTATWTCNGQLGIGPGCHRSDADDENDSSTSCSSLGGY
ncbi:hypothetical protein BU15DRAFT_58132 [Melanogaster broomeanus]|nr:hypothetical protein BU15DRAFT_58132 [Melanogaster broomeanus]